MEWKPIETAPTDESIVMVAWPHHRMEGGYMFDFWSGRYLEEMRAAIADGAARRSPHLYWLPTHWAPLPAPPT